MEASNHKAITHYKKLDNKFKQRGRYSFRLFHAEVVQQGLLVKKLVETL